VHIVESGDTLFGIALMYNVPIEQIRTLNASALGPNEIIVPGQEIVIAVPSATAVPTLPPPPPTAVPEEPATSVPEAPAVEAPATGAGASICVLAFSDQNSNTFRDDETAEGLIPGAQFTISGDSGVVAQYMSDGLTEPYCFERLAPGAYRVTSAPPAGYTVSGQAERSVAVADGTSLDVQFGIIRGENSVAENPNAETEPAGDGSGDGSGGSSSFGSFVAGAAKFVGILMLAVAAGGAVLFVLNQRRMVV
jgi:LysM repeat protein